MSNAVEHVLNVLHILVYNDNRAAQHYLINHLPLPFLPGVLRVRLVVHRGEITEQSNGFASANVPVFQEKGGRFHT